MVVISCNGSRLEVDATLTQVASRSVEVTRFPVEDGSSISDHAIKKPDTYRLDGVISNSPAIIVPGVDPANSTVGDVEAARPWSDTRAQAARELLESFVGQVCMIDVGTRLFVDMVLESIEEPRDGNTGDSVTFSASFTKIVTATSEVAQIPVASGGTKKKGGKKPTETAPDPIKKKTSAAVSIYDGVRSLAK